ncbi:MAG TPA: pantoate--beta-alanine ligase [Hyphomicrobiales bacterium]|nr:pantoate--beta-alanine ligase [Rhodobiaceae bacterium]HXK53478.1 pantoate--beta-alanine ligase [Hyphomicrobiales bacterium]
MKAALPKIVRRINALRTQVAAWRASGETVALVPTMGALHDGHLALVEEVQKRAGRVVVSIFVNPAQFGPNEDLARYPRDERGDTAKLARLGTDLVYAPSPAEIYPTGFASKVLVNGPAKAGLEDKYRPDHFAGVATVVAKLLIQCQPDIAIFGEKDYQQLMVIRRMAIDLDLPVRIVGGATRREKDGLAMSSRNIYLAASERATAPLLNAALHEAGGRIAEGGDPAKAAAAARRALTRAGFRVDYVAARNADTLAALTAPREEPIRLLAAAWLGRTRLIDNIAVKKASRKKAGA